MKRTLGILVIGIFVLSFLFATDSEVTFCCEKTKSGAYCQNVPESQCNTNYEVTPTACESTSYCKKGCCYDSDEGVCMENTPEEACRASNGMWSESADCSIAQCNLGCCVLGTEAAYVTLARCNKLTGFYGLQIDFRTDIADELSCISISTSQDLGACVFEEEFVNTCKFTTHEDCNSMTGSGTLNISSVKFYKDYLCTAEELETNCAKSTETKCEGDKVYFIDTCGNRANIYDSTKINNNAYWTKIVSSEESCSGNTKSCGNCDYLGSGSICGIATRGESPTYGNYICKDINCYDTSNGKDYKNGESWCYYDDGTSDTDSVGSRHYRHICVMGEEMIEPCSDFRNEVCIEDSIEEKGGDFSQAGCAPNRWQDCVIQNDSQDCLNSDKRDCIWIPIDGDPSKLIGNVKSIVDEQEVIANLLNINIEGEEAKGRCIPNIAPGLEFWNQGGLEVCAFGSQSCIIKYEKKLYGDRKCVENCYCEDPATAILWGSICSQYGDCGPGKNYIGRFTNEGYEIEVGKVGESLTPMSTATSSSSTSEEQFGGADEDSGQFSTAA